MGASDYGSWRIVYLTVGAVVTLFHGVFCLKIFPVDPPPKAKPPVFWRLHQIWFNLFGSLAGWGAGYYLLFGRLQPNAQKLDWTDLFAILVALLGMTGYLPNAIAGLSGGVASLTRKLLG